MVINSLVNREFIMPKGTTAATKKPEQPKPANTAATPSAPQTSARAMSPEQLEQTFKDLIASNTAESNTLNEIKGRYFVVCFKMAALEMVASLPPEQQLTALRDLARGLAGSLFKHPHRMDPGTSLEEEYAKVPDSEEDTLDVRSLDEHEEGEPLLGHFNVFGDASTNSEVPNPDQPTPSNDGGWLPRFGFPW